MKLLKITVYFLITVVIFFLLVTFYLPTFLSYKSTVDSINFLVEAWIPPVELEQVVEKYGGNPNNQFYIMGYQYSGSDEKERNETINDATIESPQAKVGVWVLANASLSVIMPAMHLVPGDTAQLTINLKGQKAAGYFAYFKLIINGELIGTGFSSDSYKDYIYKFIVPQNGITSIYIRFNNDLKTESDDRNLNVRTVSMDDFRLDLTDLNTKIERITNKITTGFDSQAAEVADYLIKLGLKPGQMHAVNFELTEENQTLVAARRFRKLSDSLSFNSINIISSKIHSRRTWITYKRILGKKVKVGITYFDDSHPQVDFEHPAEMSHVLDEFISYVINWLSLTL